jgi:hypothetical protein
LPLSVSITFGNEHAVADVDEEQSRIVTVSEFSSVFKCEKDNLTLASTRAAATTQ